MYFKFNNNIFFPSIEYISNSIFIMLEFFIKQLCNQENIIHINNDTDINNLINIFPFLNHISLVVKVDQHIKRRNKLGLIKLNLNFIEVKKTIIEWRNLGYHTFLVEPFRKIKHEYYLCFTNNLILGHHILFLENGGENIGENIQNNKNCIKLSINDTLKKIPEILHPIIKKLKSIYLEYHFQLMEINPLCLLEDNTVIPLDFACKIDPGAEYLLKNIDNSIIKHHLEYKNHYESNSSSSSSNSNDKNKESNWVEELDSKTGASFKFTLLNPNGNIWTLVAGGGASVLYTDIIIKLGYINELANYGEYSGNPNYDDLREYVTNILLLMINSFTDDTKNNKKILFIAGGIANFTDIFTTFKSIGDTLTEFQDKIKDNVKIIVRRGGPNHEKALQYLDDILESSEIEHKTFGPDKFITEIVTDILERNKKVVDIYEPYIEELDFEYPFIKNCLNKIDFTENKIIIIGCHIKLIQNMLDYEYLCNKPCTDIIGIINTTAKDDKYFTFFFGKNPILLPVYKNLETTLNEHINVDTIIELSSFRNIYKNINIILNYHHIKKIYILAEGVPENYSLNLFQKMRLQENKDKVIVGPSAIGIIQPGYFKSGNICGTLENIIRNNLHKRDGQIAIITKSGGLLNEMINIVNKFSKLGIYQAVSIGGDKYPVSTFVEHIMRFEQDKQVKLIILLGESGGIQELIISNLKKKKRINKRIIGWCYGTCQKYLLQQQIKNGYKPIVFGHAGSQINQYFEDANYKNFYMKKSGILVPNTFEEIGELIKKYSSILEKVFSQRTLNQKNNLHLENQNLKNQKIDLNFIQQRRKPRYVTSIVGDTSEELKYDNIPVEDFCLDSNNCLKKGGLGRTVGHLWFKKELPKIYCQLIELIMILCADHGMAVSGGQNVVVTTRAGKNMTESLTSGLLTIGPKFGGAVSSSASNFYNSYQENLSPREMIAEFKRNGKLIMGIGHRVKTVQNPDKRVEILKTFVREQVKYDTKYFYGKYFEYALEVEKLTLEKRNNLILNVDGCIAVIMLDMFERLKFTKCEIEFILKNDILNGFFILSRTIGFIGHYIDQKRLKQDMYRCPSEDILFY